MNAPADDRRRSWERLAARVARRVNLAWWLETMAAPLVMLGLVGACAMLLIRRESPDTPPAAYAAATAGALALIAAAGWLIARRRFERPERSMVRIEATMRLRNRLSAALAGVAPWPDPPPRVDDGLRWRWSRLLVPPLASVAFLAAGMLVPVSALSQDPGAAPDEPLGWRKIEADLDLLDQDKLVDEPYLEEVRKQVEELRQQEPEQWFSHSSLEATDNLRKRHESELERVARELGRAERALGKLQESAPGMAEAERDRLLEQFDAAMQGLRQGALQPNKALLDQLSQLDPQLLDQLDPAQLEQLREAMRRAAEGIGQCQGGDADDQWLDELLDDGGEEDDEGEGPGRGGVSRGPGTSPDVLGREGGKVETGELTGLEAEDLSRSLPGDLLQLQDGEHQVDETPTGPTAGGSVGSAGSGGERVWRDSLDPDEQRALKRFFE